MSCHKCSKSHSLAGAFLLTCCTCNLKWHHRCLVPPVTDNELVLRIRAHTTGDLANGLQAWKCNRCARSGSGSSTPNLNPPLLHSSAPPPIVVHDTKNYDDAVIVVDDSDSDPDPPPSNLSLSRSKRTSAATHPNQPAIAKTIDPNLRPSSSAPLVTRGKEAQPYPSSRNVRSATHPQPTPSSSSLSSQHLAQPITATTDDDEIIVINPSQFPNKETRRNQFRHDAKNRERNKRMEHRQRQQQLLKVKIEAKEAGALASNLDTRSQEPILRPQTPQVAGSVEHLPVPAATSVGLLAANNFGDLSQKEVNLAPQWFHDDALKVKRSMPRPRRKVQGRKLNEVRPQILNFDIMQWENRMKRTYG